MIYIKLKSTEMKKVSLEILFFFIFLILSFFYFFNLDKNFIIENNYFPWDSFEYLKFIKNLDQKKNVYTVLSPFNERVLFPFLVWKISVYSNFNFIYSALILNVLSTCLSLLIFFILSLKLKFSFLSRWAIIIIFIFSWEGPFRSSIYYSGGSFGFDCFLISLLTSLTFLFYHSKNKIIFFLLPFLFVLFTLQRGIVITAIPLFFIITNIVLKKYKQIKNYSLREDINSYCFVFSLITLITIKFSNDPAGSYSMLRNIIKFTYFRIHILEFLYTFYFALGSIFLLIISYLFFLFKRNLLKEFFSVVIQNQSYLYVFSLLLVSIFLSIVGGDDSNRFLLWFFIWYLLIGSFCFDFFIKFNKKFFIIFFLITGLLWSRFFVPAQPPMAFAEKFIFNQFISTNFDNKFFFGPEFLKKFKNKLVEDAIPLGEPYVLEKPSDIQKVFLTPNFQNPQFYYFSWWYPYKYRINDIPFPLGYLHNQRNSLVDHPTHGKPWVRFTFMLQWILVNMFFIFKFRNIKKILLR